MASSDRIISVLCTLGPSSLNRQVIERLEARKVDLFRINLSHTPLDKVEETIGIIQSHSSTTPICLDTEGAQVRTGTMQEDVLVKDRQHVRLTAETVVGDGECLSLTPPTVFEELRPNNLIGLDFDGVVLLVLKADATSAETVVLNGGKIGSNKAVVIDPAPKLPPLTDDDLAAVEIGRRMGITHFALSFANTAEDVALLRKHAGENSIIISKIESKLGVRNLDEILAETDEILIDRGDLSREVPLENIPFLQKAIIRKGNIAKKPVNVATNLLESMLVNRKPTRAELNDITNTLLDGGNGLVLAAETAIGQHPVGAVDMVLSMIERFRRSLDGHRIEDLLESSPLLLPSLHGHSDARYAKRLDRSLPLEMLKKLPAIEVDVETAMDIEQIAHGVYSPLDGFMTESQLESVLNNYRLPTGDVWTMPIILQGKTQEFAAFQPGQSIRLIDRRTSEATAILHLQDKYEVDLNSVAERWFGTTDKSHPGVARFTDRGITLLGGPIEYLGPASIARSPYQLTPEQTRALFEIKGWSKIVAFHTRNVPHRGHEHVISHACERSNADGVLIHPVIGPKKSGDFTPEAIMGAYERLISSRLPNALLAAFSTYSRYCGPREAVFTALCRKNFGCTHFVLGRDHTGVGNFYAPNNNKDLFESLGDIGIAPVFFDTVYYSEEQDTMIESEVADQKHLRSISGTMIRELLGENQPVPTWCMREEVSGWLQEMQKAEQPLFVD